MGELKFTAEEIDFLGKAVPILPKKYLQFLADFKLDPENEVVLTYDKDTQDLQLIMKGEWLTTILYEIPLLALVSEAYFKFVETDWTYDGQIELSESKTHKLVAAECYFSEFGTRRRRSKKTQQLVIEGIVKGANKSPVVLGTSNVYFAKQYGLKPVGTVAHEWMMGIAAYDMNYVRANKRAMELWLETFGAKGAGFALTDTFGTDNFLQSFVPPFTDAYAGVRQDSGDPLEYTTKVAAHYKKLGYPAGSKAILYSDSLNVERCIEYKKAAEDAGLKPFFGVGTFFTNNFKSTAPPCGASEPMNIVIKLDAMNGNHAIKISDNLAKNTGDKQTVSRVKQELGYVERQWAEGDEEHRWKPAA